MDIIVMAVSTKSNSTNVRGGSSTTPFSIISTRKAQFLAAQVENMKMMSNPLAGCFDRIELKGTLEQRRKAIISLVNNHCSVDILFDADLIIFFCWVEHFKIFLIHFTYLLIFMRNDMLSNYKSFKQSL